MRTDKPIKSHIEQFGPHIGVMATFDTQTENHDV